MNITEVLIPIAIAILYLTPLVILIAAICAVINIIFSKGQNKRSKLYLLWTFFPFILPRFAKKYGYLKKVWKQWVLVFVSPFFLIFIPSVLFSILVMAAFGTETGTPNRAIYHTSEELHKLTGVEFPDVILVDSFYRSDMRYNENCVWFVAKKPLTRKFYKELDKAVKKDSRFWSKDSTGYIYEVHPADYNEPVDRSKGIKVREPDFNSSDFYIRLHIPLKGDTITVKEVLTDG